MTPQAFIAHWRHNQISERAGAQQHFNDLCELLGQEKPRDTDNYCFERGAKTQSGQGWADVWKRGCFAWEYKAPNRDLNAALKQLMNYALALDNPPLLVVSDLRTIEIHTHFTGHPSEIHRIQIEDLTKPEARQKLIWLFTDPEKFKPQRTTFAVTEKAAQKIGEIAQRLNQRGNEPLDVAHFLIQCVFCMFAEDSKLIPEKLFETVLDKSNPDGTKAQKRLSDLFQAMQSGGDFAMYDIPWFNGGLFKNILVPDLDTADVVSLLEAARMDWSQIEPAILGTLFERGLNPDMRSQLGAHYTDPATIMKIIRPVIEEPLLAEWQPIKIKISNYMKKFEAGGKGSQIALNEAQKAFLGYLNRLHEYKVLDPACGSGNFLYLALKTLKDIEHRVNIEAEALGLHRELNIETSPANVLGIELNPYAAELARVTVWIGEIQWMILHGYQYRKNPILASLDHIENRDAILNTDGAESSWPAVDSIIGNPPFLGGSKKRRELGDAYFNQLSNVYKPSVPDGSDLVCYWFKKAGEQVKASKAKYVGLVSTNSIRGGSNRKVLERILENGTIYEAWSDQEWINEGASVRVSLICFSKHSSSMNRVSILDGKPVDTIYSDLTSGGGLDLTKSKRLKENLNIAFQGPEKNGAFDIDGDLARTWLKLPNPNGRPNSDVIKPRWNGIDLTRRYQDIWVIDYGTKTSEQAASLYEAPFDYVLKHVKPVRDVNKDKNRRNNWWRFGRTGEDLRQALNGHSRYIALSSVTKHIFWKWLPVEVMPDKALIVVALSDDASFGILHSRFHELWALRLGTSLENRPRYTPTTSFETFPFPPGMEPNNPRNNGSDDIASVAIRLNDLRDNWLNPEQWVEWQLTDEEESANYPKRPCPKTGYEVNLKKRTLTNLYNQRPSWLDNIHKELDKVVADAYGWEDYTSEMEEDEILRRLLELNLKYAT